MSISTLQCVNVQLTSVHRSFPARVGPSSRLRYFESGGATSHAVRAINRFPRKQLYITFERQQEGVRGVGSGRCHRRGHRTSCELHYKRDVILADHMFLQLRPVFADWSPFDLSSDVLLSQLKQWKHAYRLPKNLTEEDDPYRDHHPRNGHEGTDQTMTAWESLLWTMWLPRVRSAIK